MSDIHISRRNYLPFVLFTGFGVLGLWWLFHDGSTWTDMLTQWRICVYTLRGIDIYSVRGTLDYISELGSVQAGFHAAPWGLVLANLFYGGFLPFEWARIYFLTINATVIIVASYLLFSKLKAISNELSLLLLVISLLSLDFFIAVHEGNAGGIICAFLVIAWLICEEHPYISGILIGFAMVKPQDAVIVCIALLLMKKFIPLIVGAIIDVSAWAVTSFLVRCGMIELLREFLFAPNSIAEDTSLARPFAGIFSLVSDKFLLVVPASMLFGIIFICAIYHYLPKKMPQIFRIYPAFMAVTFWCYSWALDCYVLIIPVCLCLWLMIQSKKVYDFTFWMLCGFYCAEGSAFRSVACRMFMRIFKSLTYWKAYEISRTIYEIGIIALCIILCLELRRIYSEAQL